MTNASCADCGRIVAFRTHDPSEIAECRNCGTWVKRSAEMPGVAVSVKQNGPVARKTAIPPRKDEVKEPAPSPNINTTRSATKRTSERSPSTSEENLSAAAVYAAIRDLQKAVYDLRAGQKAIQADQKNLSANQHDQGEAHKTLHNGQKTLHDGQKALHSGQKQLFGQIQELQIGQQTLLERTLPVTDMPAPKQQAQVASTATPLGPLSSFDESVPPEGGFFTTPFSSLKIPLIPIRLEDLDIDPQFTDEGTVPAIPVEERSDQAGLIDGPLPEPPLYVEPEVAEPVAEIAPPEAVTTSPFEEVAFDDSAFDKAPEPTPPPLETEAPATPSSEDSFLTSAAHESPFTIEGPPDEPFTIAETSEENEQEKEASPFGITPQPFGSKEFTHEPCEIDNPFAAELEEPSAPSDEETPEGASPSTQTPEAASLPDGEKEQKSEKSLSQQIAAAKEQHQASPFDPTQRDLLTEPEKSRTLPLLAIIIGILAAIGAFLFFFTDIFKGKEEVVTKSPPLVEFPARGIPLPQDDARVAEAEKVASQFLQAKSKEDVESLIQPVDPSLLTDFWEPITAPTIERLFQGRILENDRVEIDFLINDIKGKERILPLVKMGEGPFQVDWKNFAECEDATLLGLAQGTLILDSGEELDEGAIRSYVQDGKELGGKDLGTYQGFKLHNFTEEVVALGVVRKDSFEFEILSEAIASTELKHKGKPAIRAVLRVELIEEEDIKTKKPARLEVLEIISIDGKKPALQDDIIQEKLPDVPSEEALETAPEEIEEAVAGETTPEEEAEEEPVDKELPPVPADDAPLTSAPGETPIFRVSFD
ncbi:MAG: hypothetical protein ACSHYB_17295 [Roseibacillus sp.]